MSDKAELLSMLRDIHEPPPPPSSSAWIVALFALACGLILIAGRGYLKRRKRGALRELNERLSTIKDLPPQQGLHELAKLLRQTMHHVHGDRINRLQDQEWLNELNTTFSTTYFTEDKGHVFGNNLYQHPKDLNDDALTIKVISEDIGRLLNRSTILKKLS